MFGMGNRIIVSKVPKPIGKILILTTLFRQKTSDNLVLKQCDFQINTTIFGGGHSSP